MAQTGFALKWGGIFLLTAIGCFIIKLYQQRSFFRRTVERYNLPTLPNHSWLLGNLIAVGKIMAKYPEDVHGQLMPDFLARDYPEIAEFGACYIDLWPISWPMLATFDPNIASQYTQEKSMPKHEIIRNQFRPLTGLKDLVLAEGSFWKKWRATFNPGFSTQNISALVPEFIEEASIWKKQLEQIAKDNRIVPLEDCVMRATCDIICRSVLGISLGIQSGVDDKIFPTLKGAIGLLVTDWSPAQWGRLLNPFRHVRLRRLNQALRDQLQPLIERQLENHERIEGPRTVNGLAIRNYMKTYGSQNTSSSKIDPEFLDVTVENLKIFLFAGHDTTASTLCFAYHYLYQHPDVLEKLRQEHDKILGPDTTDATRKISETPTLLNQLTYTTAIIKETLRLEPPIGSCREGSPTFFLKHPETGQQLPTDGFILFAASKAIHRNPKFWSDPDKFLPERWLEQDVHRNAYRPFELGPRGCIGQELALTELRLLLAMTVRDLEIVPAYKKGDESLYGYQAYQAHMPGELTAHPSKGMPVKVKIRAAQ
ncbi:Ff.00g015830.m01.CDS01 [Fusarium sp. VM40]|nr:Ff.00g015830.m01.CDS01 [Fusarium sp. VM40]